MDQRLFDAARAGNVSALHVLLKEDPLILEKVCLSPSAETPLHVAALAGKTDFAKEIIRLMPSFAMELNSDGFGPMHMASARGHIDMVIELLKLDPGSCNNQCLLKDKNGQIPLHYAVIKGRVPVIEELISHCPQSLQESTALGETVLHLAVKNSQFGALQVLWERLQGIDSFETIMNTKDSHGKTFIELAEETGQVLGLLEEFHSGAARNAQVDDVASTEIPGSEITEHTLSERVLHTTIYMSSDDENQTEKQETTKEKTKPSNNIEMQNLMLVAAVLIATVTYQAGLSPPPSIWQEDDKISLKCMFSEPPLLKGRRRCPGQNFYYFVIMNTAGFYSSAAIILWVTWSYKSKAVKLLGTSVWILLFSYLVLLYNLNPDILSAVTFVSLPPFLIVIIYCYDHFIRKKILKQGCK